MLAEKIELYVCVAYAADDAVPEDLVGVVDRLRAVWACGSEAARAGFEESESESDVLESFHKTWMI